MRLFADTFRSVEIDRVTELQLPKHRLFPLVPHAAGDETSKKPLSGVCSVCGTSAIFDGFTDNPRESGFCSVCGSFNRQRQLAAVLRALHGQPDAGPIGFRADYSIYNTETTGAFHMALRNTCNYTCSEYFGSEFLGGSEVGGVRHEDLQDLSFPSAAFDLVLSSDVLEHMPHPYAAHREIFRVLKPGGRHIFTVPFYPAEALDEIRAIERDGQIEYFGEKLYHGDPVRPEEGVLVWTIFGLEMIVELARIGFKVSYWNLLEPAQGIVGPWSLVFDAQKP